MARRSNAAHRQQAKNRFYFQMVGKNQKRNKLFYDAESSMKFMTQCAQVACPAAWPG